MATQTLHSSNPIDPGKSSTMPERVIRMIGTMTESRAIFIFVGYAFLRSVKPSTSYQNVFMGKVDSLMQVLLIGYEKIEPNFLGRVIPVAQTAQLGFYAIVVLFSNQMKFEVVLQIDGFCQVFNILVVSLIYFEPFAKVWVMQLGNFLYGVSTATANVFHSYVFCIFDKETYPRVAGYTRSFTMFGHMAGSFVGWVIMKFIGKEQQYFMSRVADSLGGGVANVEAEATHATDSYFSTVYFSMFMVSLFFMIVSWLVTFKFPRPKKLTKEEQAKVPKKKSNFVAIRECFVYFRNLNVVVLSIAWVFSFFSMLSNKNWYGSLWRHYQQVLLEMENNGIWDTIAYGSGAIGSMAPAFLQNYFSGSAMILLQLAVCGVCAIAAILPIMEFSSMFFYYLIHPVINFGTYFSVSFLSTKIALAIDPTLIKAYLSLMNFITFLILVLLNFYFDGMGEMPKVNPPNRYMIIAILMSISFVLILLCATAPPKRPSDPEQQSAVEEKKSK